MNTKDKICGLITLLIVIILLIFQVPIHNFSNQIGKKLGLVAESTGGQLCAGISEQAFQYDRMIASGEILAYAPELTEKDCHTFLQGHRAWESATPWSGEWCQFYAKGQYFSGFGCGFCCVASIYSTFSDYECSPLDVYEYALEETGYAPTKSSAALDWGNMKVALKNMGVQCDVYYKAASYEEFQEEVKNSKCTIALVCSANDDTLWQNVPGHYVTLWLYDEKTDTVFLGDPGSPTRNRTRIPLQNVYDALKTTSKFQYLLVDDYIESENTWRHDGIDEQWITP